LKRFLREKAFDYEVVDADGIKQGRLRPDRFAAVIVPGGKSWEYLKTLGNPGAERIREFVEQGGGYLGICAGGFYATSHREGPDPEGGARGPTETSVYEYGIGLLQATAVDGANISQYRSEFADGMRAFELLSPEGVPIHRIQSLMLEGSGWRVTEEVMRRQKVKVLARFGQSHLPAILTFERGKGRAFVTGPHLEIEEQSFYWGIPYRDPESEWPIVEAGLQYVMRGGRSDAESVFQTLRNVYSAP
jgi:glutamine amidotransferase-like uncharacterized protein